MNFSGKVALVTGGTRGIGLAVVNQLRANGATVITWSRHHPEADCRIDVRNYSDIVCGTSDVLDKHKKIDILINNAGEFGPVKSLLDYSKSEWDDVMLSNLDSQFLVCREIVPHMVKQGYGRVVNMSSIVGKDGNPMAPVYSIAKAGVIMLTKCLGRDLAQTGVTVNCVTPSPVKTGLFNGVPEETVKAMLAKVPLGRFVTVEEVASLVCWLASEECSATTGAVFDISGGRAQW